MWLIVRGQRRWAGEVRVPALQGVYACCALIVVLLASSGCGGGGAASHGSSQSSPSTGTGPPTSQPPPTVAPAPRFSATVGRDRVGPSRRDDPRRLLAPWLSGRDQRSARAPGRLLGIRCACAHRHAGREPTGGRANGRRVQGAVALALPDPADEPCGGVRRQRRAVDEGRQHVCVQLPRRTGLDRLVTTRLRARDRPQPARKPGGTQRCHRPTNGRTLCRPAIAHDRDDPSGDAAVRAFTAIGWGWGGFLALAEGLAALLRKRSLNSRGCTQRAGVGFRAAAVDRALIPDRPT